MRGIFAACLLAIGAASGSALLGSFAERSPQELLSSDDPDDRLDGAARLARSGRDGWPDDHRRAFLGAIAPLAVSSSADHCLPPSVTIAQAVLESGWGTSRRARDENNLFGMKARAMQGGAQVRTWEVVNGERVQVVASFRTYGSWAESLADHDERLATDALYAKARAVRHDREAYVDALASVYATDPAYAARLAALIEEYDLDAFDRAALEAARRRGRCAG